MSAFGEAAGTDLTGWTAAWLDRSGTDTLRLVDGAIHAESPDDGPPRPHQLDRRPATTRSGEALVPVATTDVRLDDVVTPVDLPAADLHLVNAADSTFAAVRPDEGSPAHHARPAGRPARAALAGTGRRHASTSCCCSASSRRARAPLPWCGRCARSATPRWSSRS